MLCEDLTDSLGVQHVFVDGVVCHSGNRVVDKASIRYGTQGAMHEPFLIPHGFERPVRNFAQQIENVLRSEGLHSRLIRYSEIRVSRIEGCLVAKQPLCREQIRLEGKVHMIPGSKVATVLDVACTRNNVGRKRSLYIYAWLSSDYGQRLVKRQSYGSVILEIDKGMLESIPIPLPSAAVRDRIGDLVLSASELRDKAWRIERETILELEGLIEDVPRRPVRSV